MHCADAGATVPNPDEASKVTSRSMYFMMCSSLNDSSSLMTTSRSFARLAVLALCLWSAAIVAAKPLKPTDYAVKVATDRAEPFYQKNEKVTFTITVTNQGKPVKDAKVKWKISKDGKEPPLQEGVTELQNGALTVSGSLDEPGFLQCRADFTLPGESIPTGRAAAAIDPLEIEPSLPPPDDFDAYWTAEKKKLAAVPLNVRRTSVKWPAKDVECFDAQADSIGAPLSAYLARPAGAKPGSLPAVVLCHGAGVTSSRLSIAADWAKSGFVALDFNAHGLPNGRPPAFYANLYKSDLAKYNLRGPESRETIFFHDLFLRLQRAIDVLTAQPEWDGKILVAFGRSQGGGQAIAAAGLDPRVTYVCAQIPALCDHTGVVAGRINGWPKLVPIDESGKPNEKALQAARYFDAVNFATRTKAGAFFTVGFIDVSCPPTSIYAAYNRISGGKKIVDMFHLGHVATPEADNAARAAALEHVKAP